MRTQPPARWPLMAALVLLACATILATRVLAQGGDEEAAKPDPQPGVNGNGNGAGAAAPALPGFVYLPAGDVQPGCTLADYQARHQGNEQRKMALIYDVWGNIPKLAVPAFYAGKYEVTNAQWKHYLDTEHRIEHKCDGMETLETLAERFVTFRGNAVKSEWIAIYGLNAQAIMKAIRDRDQAELEKDPKARLDWNLKWTLENPDPQNDNSLARIHLPKGLKLTFYSHRVPHHWYGWCKLSGLRVGKEFCDPEKPASEAFQAPAAFAEYKLRDKDFASYPIRDVSPNEIFAFAEWAGCHLLSEYEWEYAVRQSRPNTAQHPFPGAWDHRKQKGFYAWANNTVCRLGPLPVDAASVAKGDTKYGARHMLGNVYELTRTFWDFHPYVVPKPPPPAHGLFNYALVAKGGSFGDGWEMIQTSSRTGWFGGAASLDLVENNRVDTVGFRLVRHARQGYDLLLHSILRLTYERGRGQWAKYTPLHFNMGHMAGTDTLQIKDAKAPYVFVQGKAAGVAFAPLWISDINKGALTTMRNRWRQAKAVGAGPKYFTLGILRSDRPLYAGVRLTKNDEKELVAARAEFKKKKEEFDRQQKRKKRKRKKDGEEEAEIVMPPKPAEPDEYEKATEGKHVGLWRGKVVAPGEWYVVYWNGFIGLANKALVMPPDAIIILPDEKKALRYERKPTAPTTLRVFEDQNYMALSFSTEEQLSGKKHDEAPPGAGDSDLWASCEVHPLGWKRRNKVSKSSWFVDVQVPLPKTEPKKQEPE